MSHHSKVCRAAIGLTRSYPEKILRIMSAALLGMLLSIAAFGQSGDNWGKSVTTKYWTTGKDNNGIGATLTVSCDEVPNTAYKWCTVNVHINCLTAIVSSPHAKERNDVFAQVQFDDGPLKIVVGKTDADNFSAAVQFFGDKAFLTSMNKAKKLRMILSYTTNDLVPEHGVQSG